jgi:hypothetical protein
LFVGCVVDITGCRGGRGMLADETLLESREEEIEKEKFERSGLE